MLCWMRASRTAGDAVPSYMASYLRRCILRLNQGQPTNSTINEKQNIARRMRSGHGGALGMQSRLSFILLTYFSSFRRGA